MRCNTVYSGLFITKLTALPQTGEELILGREVASWHDLSKTLFATKDWIVFYTFFGFCPFSRTNP